MCIGNNIFHFVIIHYSEIAVSKCFCHCKRYLGFSSYGHLEDDDDLDNLRSDARFQRLLKDLEKRHEAKQAMKKKHKEHKEKHKHIH